MWAAMTTRPDLAFAVSVLSRLCAAPTEQAWQSGLRVLRYLKGTRTTGLVLGGAETWRQDGLEAWSDADWAGDVQDRRSTSGYVLKFQGTAISWGTVKQKAVALSTTEAEYYALTEVIKDVAWVRSMLKDFGIQQTTVTVHCDNQSAIALANNPAHHRSTKHIDLRYHFIRNMVTTKRIVLRYVDTGSQTADILTKSLPGPVHNTHKKSLGLADQADTQGHVLVTAQAPAGQAKQRGRGKCFRCNELGHFKADCPKQPAKNKPTLAERMGPKGQGTRGATDIPETHRFQVTVTTQASARPIVKVTPISSATPTHHVHPPAETGAARIRRGKRRRAEASQRQDRVSELDTSEGPKVKKHFSGAGGKEGAFREVKRKEPYRLEPIVIDVDDVSNPPKMKARIAVADTTVSSAAEVQEPPGGWENLTEIPDWAWEEDD